MYLNVILVLCSSTYKINRVVISKLRVGPTNPIIKLIVFEWA